MLEKEKDKNTYSLKIKDSKNDLIKKIIPKLNIISNNPLSYIFNFFTIQECFTSLKINKRIKNSILKNHKNF